MLKIDPPLSSPCPPGPEPGGDCEKDKARELPLAGARGVRGHLLLARLLLPLVILAGACSRGPSACAVAHTPARDAALDIHVPRVELRGADVRGPHPIAPGVRAAGRCQSS